ncbi:MAG: AbrB/MazE/SpoVT family DNA-binding domain-containing protein [Polyangiaceae bacterium]
MAASRSSARKKDSQKKAALKETPVDRPFVARAKLFADGRDQAIRLPAEFRMEGSEVLVRREGNRLIVEPVDSKGWPVDLWSHLDALAEGLDEEWQRPADTVPPPIERERELP